MIYKNFHIFYQGFSFGQLQRNNDKFNDDTRSWLIEQFNEWQVFDVQTQKWKSVNVNGGDYTDLMKRFTTKFPKAEDQLTEKQIRSFFSRLRKKIKTRVN